MLATLTPVTQLYAETDWLTHYQSGGKVWLFRFRFRFYRFFFQQFLGWSEHFFCYNEWKRNVYNQEFGWMFCSLQVLAGQSRFGYLPGSLTKTKEHGFAWSGSAQGPSISDAKGHHETRIISSRFGCWQMKPDIFSHIATSRVAAGYSTDYQYQCRSGRPTCFSKLAVTSIVWV